MRLKNKDVPLCQPYSISRPFSDRFTAAGYKRYALPNARIMIHQPWGGAEGKASDIEITAREILRLKEILNQILATHSGKALEDVVRDTDRDHFMSAAEACSWGLIDKVLDPKKA